MLNAKEQHQVLFRLYERTATNIAYNIMYTVAVETNKIIRDEESIHYIQNFSADLINSIQKITLLGNYADDEEIDAMNDKIKSHLIDKLLGLQNKFDFTCCELLIEEVKIDIVQFLSLSSYIKQS